MNRSHLALGVMGLALAVAGCGGSSSTASTTSTAANSSYASSATATTSASAAANGASASSGYGESSGTQSASTAQAASTATVVTVKHNSSLGNILAAGPKHLTVYLLTADHGSHSSCSGECAQIWPPVTTKGHPIAQGGALASDLGTTTRSGGVKQVTYKGHPLYYYVQDTSSSEALGQGISSFGGVWWALAPNGNAVKG
jgi:predicted lipoprotein with Yx(FWY)xxD motif